MDHITKRNPKTAASCNWSHTHTRASDVGGHEVGKAAELVMVY